MILNPELLLLVSYFMPPPSVDYSSINQEVMTVNLFNAAFYQSVNPDLAVAGLTTQEQLFEHFQAFGLREGRAFLPLVDLNFYRENNADLAAFDNQQLFEHLQTHGIAEGRTFSRWINLSFYRENNRDLANFNNQQLFEHLQTNGIGEGRRFSEVVDLGFYLQNNSDVEQAFGGDRILALQHLNAVGFREGRNFSPTFKFDTTFNNFISADSTNVIIDWNRTLLNAIQTSRASGGMSTRNMAMVHTAMYDAVNAIAKSFPVYRVEVEAPDFASPEAAAAAAAHRVLVNLYPQQTATFDTALASSLAEVPDGKSENDGVNLGQFVADQILAWRRTDGSNIQVPYFPQPNPGSWVPTPPNFAPATTPQWANVTPFAINSTSQFRQPGPKVLSTAEYAEEFNLVKELGSRNSPTRTAEQTEIARFWAGSPNALTPPTFWNKISQEMSLRHGGSLIEDVRLFALLNVALADTSIATWDTKYAYNSWRPITAIRQADTDNNSLTETDPNWEPLLGSPAFPAYVSGHSAQSGTAEIILSSVFGNDVAFSAGALDNPDIVRSYSSFSQAAEETSISRLYGGIHFPSDNIDGLVLGRSVANYVLENFF